MKTSILIVASIITLSISLSSCKEDDEVLPPITMDGRNTFGCLVNGEVWLPEGRGGSSGVFVDMTIDNFLSIGVDNKKSGMTLVIIDSTGLKVNNLYIFERDTKFYSRYNFVEEDKICFYDVEHLLSGEMMITKLENQIISGTFEFITYNPDCGDTIKVTEGRFDIGSITR